jgi:uncharacterized membrane protein
MPSLDERVDAGTDSGTEPRHRRLRRPPHLALLNDNVRLFVAAGVAFLAQALVDLPGGDRLIAAWDIGAILYLALTWWFMLNPRAWDTRRWIAAQDAPRSRASALLLGPQANLALAIAVSLVGVGAALALLGRSNDDQSSRQVLHALGVILAWLVLNTAYTLYYVYLYYRGGRIGLSFPIVGHPASTADEHPDQLDFAYFAFTVATAFATSDVQITDRTIRRTVLGHSVLAFGYNTAILSVAVGFLTGF